MILLARSAGLSVLRRTDLRDIEGPSMVGDVVQDEVRKRLGRVVFQTCKEQLPENTVLTKD